MAKNRDEEDQAGNDCWEQDDEAEPSASESSPTLITPGITPETRSSSSLAEVFGYYGQSKFNTMALVRKVSRFEVSSPAKVVLAVSTITLITSNDE